MDVVVMIAQLLLGLSILVGVHELGHFLTAKWFKMRVEQFALGLPPQMFGLKFLPAKIFSVRHGETEYLLSPLPLGGYVKIAGMMDESMDTEQMASEPQPWEFRSKPAWQRLIVMMGGIIVNVITGIVIFGFLLLIYGEQYIPTKALKYGIVAGPVAQNMGLRTGDKIVKLNGQTFEDFSDISKSLLNSGSYYTVERKGQLIDLQVPDKLLNDLSNKKSPQNFIFPRMTFTVDTVPPVEQPGFLARLILQMKGKDPVAKESPAQKIGLQSGDKIEKVNGTPIRFFDELQETLKANKGKTVTFTINHKGTIRESTTQLDTTGVLGFIPKQDIETATIDYSFGEAFAKAPARAFEVIGNQLKAFGKIFRGELSPTNSLGSFISIGKLYGGIWDWEKFWSLTATLSMVLAFMNFLPIPVLDGGHVVFLLYEMIAGRAPSQKFMEVALRFGMVLLFGLMAFAIGLDFYRLVR
ncbi:RIP metalloprotease RseP [Xanthocytophaga agilis]|uniref:Zinc metalloprotease n=1 Tax=Xanthocytophaga agilis TaxID=3048010 RepID=A0AAE3R963_9BACT|nr:RIP metalloprotease RseP [Xanthocytophaga agilis]MDJ1503062.1 RIP metalloprotease RseP [Xanthocytophaga agilis]